MASTQELWTKYNSHGFAAEYSHYSERARADVNNNDITLTIADSKVSQIGGKDISATSAKQDASGNVITETYATKSELPSAMTGATASTDGESGLVPAPAAGDEEKLLTGDGNWTALENDVFGTQLLDENNRPVLAEESTQDNPIYVYDVSSTDQLWTGFAGKGFGAIRTYADQDGHNIKATYATKEDLNAALGNIETLLAAI